MVYRIKLYLPVTYTLDNSNQHKLNISLNFITQFIEKYLTIKEIKNKLQNY